MSIVSDLIKISFDSDNERVAIVTLNDVRRRNALTIEMSRLLAEAIGDLEGRNDVGAVVITGSGTSFCSGADLSTLANGPTEATLRDIYAGFLKVARSPLPMVAAVNGPAVGAGLNLALSCDVRIASQSARFDARFLRLGIHPGGGHGWMMHRIVGPQGAAAMTLFGESLDGFDAQRIGLVWRCVENNRLLSESTSLASGAAAAPRELVAMLRETNAEVEDGCNFNRSIGVELAAQLTSMSAPSFKERISRVQRSRGC
jgi:enoyl-CoA hydratase